MKYTLKFLQPTLRLITVSIETNVNEQITRFYLPKWRPGRYELQNFAQYVSDFSATTVRGELLNFKKTETNVWEVEAPPGTRIQLEYSFYANQPDAGGSYFDGEQIYVNGINLFMYRKGLLDEACQLHIELPTGYQIGIGLPKTESFYLAKDFHELVDSPFLAGNKLIHHEFEVRGIPMHLWFQGVCKPHLTRIETDFRAYSEAQLALFGDFPVSEYHYFIRMLPYTYRHGVEHCNSTVIVMGPGHELMQPAKYKSFLEICSHELFHTWNVKYLRPKDMFPYQYDSENYSRLHYITEGITTYYGDLMIWKGKKWNFGEWIDSINGELRTHYLKGGKDFISLEEASFNSWSDGYDKPGTPNRKISFYTKGYLIAMLLDFEIRRSTDERFSLDDVVHRMYQEIGKSDRGYTRQDYKALLEEVSGKKLDNFFAKYISGTEDIEPLLTELGDYYGLELNKHAYPTWVETFLGMRVATSKNQTTIEHLLPDCPAAKAGLSLEDELISLNRIKIENNLEGLFAFFGDVKEWEFHYFREKQLKVTRIPNDQKYRAYIPQFQNRPGIEAKYLDRRLAWQQIKVNSILVN